MGVRQTDTRAQFSPVASAKDVGRIPLRKFGQVDLDRIVPDPEQPRTVFDDEELDHLAKSIREKGQLHPIRVRWDEATEKWVIVTGERRWRATKAAGLQKIDCYFVDGQLKQSEVLEQQLVENLLRQDLKPMDEARGYASLMELNGWNGKQVAEALRVSTSKVSRALALLDLPEDIRQQIETGVVSRTAAYELTKLENEEVLRNLATQSEPLTKRQTAKAVRQRKGKPRTARRPDTLSLKFQCSHGIEVVVRVPRGLTYAHVSEASDEFAEEVDLRLRSNIQLL